MRKKVLFVIEALAGGGAEKVLTTMVQNLDARKFDISLCCITNTGLYTEVVKPYVHYSYILPDYVQLSAVGRVWYHIKYWLIYRVLPLSWVYRLFLPKDNDVEVAFVEGFTTKLMAHSSNRKAQKLAWVHIDLNQMHWTLNKGVFKDFAEEKSAYARFDNIVCVSSSVRNSFLKEFVCEEQKLYVVYNPIDTKDIILKSKERIEKRMDSSLIRLLSVGRLVPQKGYDVLLKVLKQLKDEGFRFHLLILGDGTMRANLEHDIVRLDLENEVSLLGFQHNPYKYIAEADLFVCSSRAEGYSLVIAEAMVLGVPVLSTDCSGPNELLNYGEYGLLVENSERGLFEGLKTLLGKKQLLSYYTKQAQKRGLQFELQSSIRRIEKLLMQSEKENSDSCE